MNILTYFDNLIDEKLCDVDKNPLFMDMKNYHIGNGEPLSFSPSMFYYIMGFKDILICLKRVHPNSIIEQSINTYCEEDAHHWKWYLEALGQLNSIDINSWEDFISFSKYVWGVETFAARDLLYDIIHFAKDHSDVIYSVVVIMVFEKMGLKFLTATRNVMEMANLSETIFYFGNKHFEEEVQHAGFDFNIEFDSLGDGVLDHCINIIETMINGYDKMFVTWSNYNWVGRDGNS